MSSAHDACHPLTNTFKIYFVSFCTNVCHHCRAMLWWNAILQSFFLNIVYQMISLDLMEDVENRGVPSVVPKYIES